MTLKSLCWRRTRQLTPSPWRSSTLDLTSKPRWTWRVEGTAWGWWGMREGRWRWWRDQGSQRKRSLHAWMRWDKHSDILNLEPCDVCKEWVWQCKTTKTNNYTHIHVLTKCVTSLSGFMCFVLILVFTLSLVSGRPHRSCKKVWYVNFIFTTHTQFSKYKVLFFWML